MTYNGYVYVLKSNLAGGLVYYGSTIKPLEVRLWEHTTNYNRYVSGKNPCYCSSYELVKYPDVRIELVEEFSGNSRQELEARESYYIVNNSCCNRYRPTNGIDYTKYYLANRESILQKRRQKVRCECGTYTRRGDLHRHRKSQRHKEVMEIQKTEVQKNDSSKSLEDK